MALILVVKVYVESVASLFGGLRRLFVFDFMDDLVVYSKSFGEQPAHLREMCS